MGYYQDVDDAKDDFGASSPTDHKLFNQMTARYCAGKRAETGATIPCACCGKLIVKKTYHKKFCRTKCKDRYWNVVNPRGFFGD